MKPSDPDDRIFDVNRPGKTPAHSTSRPLITTQQNLLGQDPMMSDQSSALQPSPAQNPLTPVIERVAQESANPGLVVMEHHDLEGVTTPAPQTVIEPVPSEEEQPADAEQASMPAVSAPTEKTDTSENTPVPKTDSKATEEEAMRQQTYEKTIADKTYFIPIGQIKHGRPKSVILLPIILVLLGVFAAAYFVLQ